MPRLNRLPIVLTAEHKERFWRTVELTPSTTHDDCWRWTGRTDGFGYGHFKVKTRSLKAHRVAWTIERGPIPDDKTLDHLCRNPCCVNPKHLALVSNRENILRGTSPTADNARKIQCPRGHALTVGNLVASRTGKRECLQCKRTLARERYAASTD